MTISIGTLPLKSKADVILHPIKYKDNITYEPMSEEAVIGLITKYFAYDNMPDYLKEYFDEMDDGYLFSESNFDEFDLEKIKPSKLLVGRDILLHPRLENIKKFLTILRDYGNFEIENIDLISEPAPSDNELAEILLIQKEISLEEIEELETFNGSVVYECEDFEIVKEDEILCSHQFIIANKIKSSHVLVDGVKKRVKKVEELKGTFGIVFNLSNEYPFKKVKIENI